MTDRVEDEGLLSVVMPVYNEADYLHEILRRVQSVDPDGFEIEIVVVDDGSDDGTTKRLRTLEETRKSGEETFAPGDGDVPLLLENLTVRLREENRGKGAALREGFRHVEGDVVVIQDADLEYDPAEYGKMLEPIRQGRADVVYGSRFLGGPQRALYFRHYLGNKGLTMLSNLLTDMNLTDVETCYKMFRRSVLEGIELREPGFGFEPEFTAKVAREGYRVYEVPISYYGRTYEEGKKIGWKDGLDALRCILQYNL